MSINNFLKNQKNLELLLHSRGGPTHIKHFSGNDSSRGKNIRESEFDIFEANKRFLDSGKASVLKQKLYFYAEMPRTFVSKSANLTSKIRF
jgi:hypothetical protein